MERVPTCISWKQGPFPIRMVNIFTVSLLFMASPFLVATLALADNEFKDKPAAGTVTTSVDGSTLSGAIKVHSGASIKIDAGTAPQLTSLTIGNNTNTPSVLESLQPLDFSGAIVINADGKLVVNAALKVQGTLDVGGTSAQLVLRSAAVTVQNGINSSGATLDLSDSKLTTNISALNNTKIKVTGANTITNSLDSVSTLMLSSSSIQMQTSNSQLQVKTVDLNGINKLENAANTADTLLIVNNIKGGGTLQLSNGGTVKFANEKGELQDAVLNQGPGLQISSGGTVIANKLWLGSSRKLSHTVAGDKLTLTVNSLRLGWPDDIVFGSQTVRGATTLNIVGGSGGGNDISDNQLNMHGNDAGVGTLTLGSFEQYAYMKDSKIVLTGSGTSAATALNILASTLTAKDVSITNGTLTIGNGTYESEARFDSLTLANSTKIVITDNSLLTVKNPLKGSSLGTSLVIGNNSTLNLPDKSSFTSGNLNVAATGKLMVDGVLNLSGTGSNSKMLGTLTAKKLDFMGNAANLSVGIWNVNGTSNTDAILSSALNLSGTVVLNLKGSGGQINQAMTLNGNSTLNVQGTHLWILKAKSALSTINGNAQLNLAKYGWLVIEGGLSAKDSSQLSIHELGNLEVFGTLTLDVTKISEIKGSIGGSNLAFTVGGIPGGTTQDAIISSGNWSVGNSATTSTLTIKKLTLNNAAELGLSHSGNIGNPVTLNDASQLKLKDGSSWTFKELYVGDNAAIDISNPGILTISQNFTIDASARPTTPRPSQPLSMGFDSKLIVLGKFIIIKPSVTLEIASTIVTSHLAFADSASDTAIGVDATSTRATWDIGKTGQNARLIGKNLTFAYYSTLHLDGTGNGTEATITLNDNTEMTIKQGSTWTIGNINTDSTSKINIESGSTLKVPNNFSMESDSPSASNGYSLTMANSTSKLNVLGKLTLANPRAPITLAGNITAAELAFTDSTTAATPNAVDANISGGTWNIGQAGQSSSITSKNLTLASATVLNLDGTGQAPSASISLSETAKLNIKPNAIWNIQNLNIGTNAQVTIGSGSTLQIDGKQNIASAWLVASSGKGLTMASATSKLILLDSLTLSGPTTPITILGSVTANELAFTASAAPDAATVAANISGGTWNIGQASQNSSISSKNLTLANATVLNLDGTGQASSASISLSETAKLNIKPNATWNLNGLSIGAKAQVNIASNSTLQINSNLSIENTRLTASSVTGLTMTDSTGHLIVGNELTITGTLAPVKVLGKVTTENLWFVETANTTTLADANISGGIWNVGKEGSRPILRSKKLMLSGTAVLNLEGEGFIYSNTLQDPSTVQLANSAQLNILDKSNWHIGDLSIDATAQLTIASGGTLQIDKKQYSIDGAKLTATPAGGSMNLTDSNSNLFVNGKLILTGSVAPTTAGTINAYSLAFTASAAANAATVDANISTGTWNIGDLKEKAEVLSKSLTLASTAVLNLKHEGAITSPTMTMTDSANLNVLPNSTWTIDKLNMLTTAQATIKNNGTLTANTLNIAGSAQANIDNGTLTATTLTIAGSAQANIENGGTLTANTLTIADSAHANIKSNGILTVDTLTVGTTAGAVTVNGNGRIVFSKLLAPNASEKTGSIVINVGGIAETKFDTVAIVMPDGTWTNKEAQFKGIFNASNGGTVLLTGKDSDPASIGTWYDLADLKKLRTDLLYALDPNKPGTVKGLLEVQNAKYKPSNPGETGNTVADLEGIKTGDGQMKDTEIIITTTDLNTGVGTIVITGVPAKPIEIKAEDLRVQGSDNVPDVSNPKNPMVTDKDGTKVTTNVIVKDDGSFTLGEVGGAPDTGTNGTWNGNITIGGTANPAGNGTVVISDIDVVINGEIKSNGGTTTGSSNVVIQQSEVAFGPVPSATPGTTTPGGIDLNNSETNLIIRDSTVGADHILVGDTNSNKGNTTIDHSTVTVDKNLDMNGATNIISNNSTVKADSVITAGDITIDQSTVTVDNKLDMNGATNIIGNNSTVKADSVITAGDITIDQSTVTVDKNLDMNGTGTNIISNNSTVKADSVITVGNITIDQSTVTVDNKLDIGGAGGTNIISNNSTVKADSVNTAGDITIDQSTVTVDKNLDMNGTTNIISNNSTVTADSVITSNATDPGAGGSNTGNLTVHDSTLNTKNDLVIGEFNDWIVTNSKVTVGNDITLADGAHTIISNNSTVSVVGTLGSSSTGNMTIGDSKLTVGTINLGLNTDIRNSEITGDKLLAPIDALDSSEFILTYSTLKMNDVKILARTITIQDSLVETAVFENMGLTSSSDVSTSTIRASQSMNLGEIRSKNSHLSAPTISVMDASFVILDATSTLTAETLTLNPEVELNIVNGASVKVDSLQLGTQTNLPTIINVGSWGTYDGTGPSTILPTPSSGSLSAGSASFEGGILYIRGNEPFAEPENSGSTVALGSGSDKKTEHYSLDGRIVSSEASKLTLGSTDASLLTHMLTETGELKKLWGKEVREAVYLANPLQFTANANKAYLRIGAAFTDDGKYNGTVVSTVRSRASTRTYNDPTTKQFYLATEGVLALDASTLRGANAAAITAFDPTQSATVEKGARFHIAHARGDDKLVVLQNFASVTDETLAQAVIKPDQVSFTNILLKADDLVVTTSGISLKVIAEKAIEVLPEISEENGTFIDKYMAQDQQNPLMDKLLAVIPRDTAVIGHALDAGLDLARAANVEESSRNTVNTNMRAVLKRTSSNLNTGTEIKFGFNVWGMPMVFSSTSNHALAGSSFKVKNRTHSYGGIIGADIGYNKARVGISVNVGQGKSEGNSSNINTKNNFDYAGTALYAQYDFGNFNLGATAGFTNINSEITQKQPNLVLSGKPKSTLYHVGLEGTYTFELETGITIVPSLGLEWVHYQQSSYNTAMQNAGNVVHAASSSGNQVQVPVGVKVQKNFVLSNGTVLSPELRVKIIPTLGATMNTKIHLTNIESVSDHLKGANSDRVMGEIGIELPIRFTDSLSFSAGYDLGISKSVVRHNIRANLKYSF